MRNSRLQQLERDKRAAKLDFILMSIASDWRKSAFWVLRVNFAIVIIDLILLLAWLLLQNAGFVGPIRKDFFAVLLLLESALIFLTGGAIAISSTVLISKIREYFFRSKEKWSPEKHRESETRANLYILVGILLFLESIVLALLL